MDARIPKQLTVDLAISLATEKEIVVRVSSVLELSQDGRKIVPKVKFATITKESELTPELVLGGPKLRGDVNCYTLCDARRAYFNAKTGEAIGRGLQSKPSAKQKGRTNAVVMASQTSQGVNREYLMPK